eukprot:91088-Rhodomonas_salina.1
MPPSTDAFPYLPCSPCDARYHPTTSLCDDARFATALRLSGTDMDISCYGMSGTDVTVCHACDMGCLVQMSSYAALCLCVFCGMSGSTDIGCAGTRMHAFATGKLNPQDV